MRLNLIQFIAFAFMLGWIAIDVAGGSYSEHLTVASFLAFITAYLHNAHGLLWQRIKKLAKH